MEGVFLMTQQFSQMGQHRQAQATTASNASRPGLNPSPEPAKKTAPAGRPEFSGRACEGGVSVSIREGFVAAASAAAATRPEKLRKRNPGIPDPAR